jgi:NAD(P)-dependent dehydrogenase (short-subunit alcohol dehydrogenase family)
MARFQLDGKVALVTGAARGIGLATARALLARGASVAIVDLDAAASERAVGFIETEMVHQAIDADPLAAEMFDVLPAPLRKRLPAKAAGEAIVRGIERRRPRIVAPRRWTAMSLLRGLLNPLSDARLEREARTQELVRRMDARAGEEQSTTA